MENEPTPLISVVVPLYKEAVQLRTFFDKANSELAGTGLRYELIAVDDGSPDETWQVISEQVQNLPHLHALRLSRNFGKEAAIAAGLLVATS